MNKNDLKKLIELKTENQNIDYKQGINWNDISTFEKGEIIKDVLAFSNTLNGGKLIFGVEDTSYKDKGVDQDCFNSFDTTSFNDFLEKYTEPNHCCYIHKYEIEDRKYIVVDVPEFTSTPIICKKNLTNNEKIILQEGAIYIRTNSAKSIKIQDHVLMNDLLLRAIKHKSNELLSNIEILLSGRSKEENKADVFLNNIEIANNEINMKIGKELRENKYGNNYLIIYPSIDLSSVFTDINELKMKFNNSVINNRGWDFPHIQNNNENGNNYNIDNGFSSYTIWTNIIEAFCIFRNGLLVWQSVFWEDLEMEDKGTLSFIKVIYDLFEYCTFISRFYDIEDVNLDINVELSLNNCYKKRLVSGSQAVPLFRNHTCEYSGDIKIKESFNIIDYITRRNEILTNFAKQIFNYFNFEIDESIINDWIKRYESRKF